MAASSSGGGVCGDCADELDVQGAVFGVAFSWVLSTGVTVDPAQALARGVTPDALRQSVLKQAAERDVAQDIVAEAPLQPQTKPQSVADSPLVKAAQAYGAQK